MARTYNVIDADGHVLEPIDIWDKYIDPAFRERLRQGPGGSRVSQIEEQEISPVPEWDGFVIDR